MKMKLDLLVSFFAVDVEEEEEFPEGMDSNNIFTNDFDQRYLY